MRADDDGFVDKPKAIERLIKATDEDLKKLEGNGLVHSFNPSLVVIMAWHSHNTIRKDLYKPTVYQEERSHLRLGNNKFYIISDEGDSLRNRNGNVTDSARSIEQTKREETRVDKDSTDRTRGIEPVRLSDDSIYYSLSPKDIDALTTLCEEKQCDLTELLDLVDTSIKNRKEQTEIPNPFRYIVQVAENNDWNPATHSKSYVPKTVSSSCVKRLGSIEGSLWDYLDDNQKANMRTLYSEYDLDGIIASVDAHIQEHPEEEWKGSHAALFKRLANDHLYD